MYVISAIKYLNQEKQDVVKLMEQKRKCTKFALRINKCVKKLKQLCLILILRLELIFFLKYISSYIKNLINNDRYNIPFSYSFINNSRGEIMRRGIDVSVYQRNIDWRIAKDYIDFAIIRCGYGNDLVSQDDPYYRRNALECTRLKIPFGVYLFSYATDLKMAQSEVDHTLRLIKDYKLEYPVFIDIEEREQLRLPKERLIEIVKYYCDKIEEAGYYVGIYASLNTLNNQLNSSELDRFDKWVAEWGKDFSYSGSSGMWQYTDDARVPGVGTKVDGDIAFYNYPQIIRENGLNHLDSSIEPPDTIGLKYKVGDELFFNGYLYDNDTGKDVIREYCNERVIITDAINRKDIVAPYKLNIGGYAKEDDLTPERLNRACWCVRMGESVKDICKNK